MTFGTVIEIIVAVFAVFGLYTVTKMLAYVLAYDKKVRRSVTIAVQISPDDDEELREIKRPFYIPSIKMKRFGLSAPEFEH